MFPFIHEVHINEPSKLWKPQAHIHKWKIGLFRLSKTYPSCETVSLTLISASSYHSNFLPFYHSTILPFYHSTILPFYHSTILPFHHSTILSFYHSTCSATTPVSYPASLRNSPNGCQGHPRSYPPPPDRPPVTEPDSNSVRTRCNFYSTIGMGWQKMHKAVEAWKTEKSPYK